MVREIRGIGLAPSTPAGLGRNGLRRRDNLRVMASFDRFVQSTWAYAALAIFVFIAAAPGMVSMPVLDRDEGRFTQASAQMLETGDYVVIRYHEGLRNKKPVAIHWAQAGSVAALSTAEARDIAIFRLPSLLGAMLAAMATFYAGSALFNRRAAFIGAALFASTLLLTTEAHIGKTDAAQVGVLTLGIAALAWLRRGGGRAHAILFWVCLAAGVMLKGPIAPMIAGLTVLSLFLWERKIAWARPLLYWVGLSLFVILTVPWYIAVQIATDGEFLFEAVAVDLGPKIVSAAEGHSGPPGMHTAGVPLLFWPATLFLIPGIMLAISSLLRRPGAQLERKGANRNAADAVAKSWTEQEAGAWRFVVCWLLPSWIVFEIAPTKLFHYTLPMYPAFALMAGAAADKWFSSVNWTGGRWTSLILFALVSILLAAVATPNVLEILRTDAAGEFAPLIQDRVAWTWREDWNATGIGVWPTLLIALVSIATIVAFVRKMPMATLAGVLACSLVGGIAYRAVILPNQTWMLATPAALSALKEICAVPEGSQQWIDAGCQGQGPQVVRAIAYAEPSFVFEVGGRVTLPPSTTTAIPSLQEDPRPAWLINAGEPEGREALAALTAAASAADRCIRFSRRYALNYSNGDPSILVAAVIEPAGCPGEVAPPPPPEPEPVLEQ